MLNDLRFAIRQLRNHPGFTAVAVLTLGLGVGAATAIFSLIDALMLRSLPVREPGRLVLFKRIETSNRTVYDLAYPMFERLQNQPQVFSDVAANWLIERSEAADTPGAEPGQVRVGMASGNYFSTLGVQAVAGRIFTVADNRLPGGHPVAVISHSYWERRFALAPDIVGRTITLSGTTYTIVGVTPPRFTGEWIGRPADLWVPFMMASQVMPEVPGGPPKFPALIIARLKPGATRTQAQVACQLVYKQALRDEAGSSLTSERLRYLAQRRIELESAVGGYSPHRNNLGYPLQILAGMVGLVLLAVCANVANLLLARAAARERELAVRRALGAHYLRIMRQLLTESLLLAVIGSALGLLFSVWGTSVLTTMLGAGPLAAGVEDNSLSLDLRLDGRLIAWTAALSVFVCVLFGLAPALRSSQVALTTALKQRGAHAGTRCGRISLGRMLVIVQVALSLALLIGAGLLVGTLRNLRIQDVGFNQANLLLIWTAPVRTGRTVPVLADFAKTLEERLVSLPGVLSASVSNGGVLDGSVTSGRSNSETLSFQGQLPKPGLTLRQVAVSPGFLATVGTPLVAGRDFNEMDTDKAPQVAILNETMARFFFGSENPVGQRFSATGESGFPIEVVGVVKDAKLGTPRDRRGAWYFPYRQNSRFLRLNWCVAVRTSGPPSGFATSIRQALHDLDPNLPVLKVTTIEGQLDHVLAQERLMAMLSGFFGVLATLLSALGLYGVMSYTVTRRVSEIGIRLAMGATPQGVLRLVLKESVTLILGGIALGVPFTVAVTRVISTWLFGISPMDPLTMAGVLILVLAVGMLAAFLPAHRASRVDPMTALRCE